MRDMLGAFVVTAILMLMVCLFGWILGMDEECVMCEGTGRYLNSACIFCD